LQDKGEMKNTKILPNAIKLEALLWVRECERKYAEEWFVSL